MKRKQSWAWTTSTRRILPTQHGRLQRLGRRMRSCLRQWQGKQSGAGARQHSMGVCDAEPGRCAAVCSIGRGSRAGPGRLQPAGSCQHSMGVCDAWADGCTAVQGNGKGNRAAPGHRASPTRRGRSQRRIGKMSCCL